MKYGYLFIIEIEAKIKIPNKNILTNDDDRDNIQLGIRNFANHLLKII